MKTEHYINDKKTDIFFGEMIIESLFNYIKTELKVYNIFIITGKNVSGFYKKKIENLIFNSYEGDNDYSLILENQSKGFFCHLSKNKILNYFELEAGEKSKNQRMRNKLEMEIIKREPSKNSVIIAFGGGVIGDLSGLLASTVFRGIKLINVPTSLLAMIDSSIGGKNGINLPFAKNVIGTIYQPNAVFIDPLFLDTLPFEEYLNGLCEIVKTFAVCDKDGFEFLEKNIIKILKKDRQCLTAILEKCVNTKLEIIKKDVNEHGIRSILNFGHTIGHAIEVSGKFKIKHGFAVLLGMILESENAVKNNLLDEKSFLRLVSLSKNILSEIPPIKIQSDKIEKYLSYDKKRENNEIRYSVISDIGVCKYNITMKNIKFNSEFILL